jgi:hypothetical protein
MFRRKESREDVLRDGVTFSSIYDQCKTLMDKLLFPCEKSTGNNDVES